MKQDTLPTIGQRRTLHAGRWLTLQAIPVTHTNGKTSSYEVVTRNADKVQGIVSILPFTPGEKEVILIRQFRFPLGYAHLENPAGCREPKKHPTLEDVVRDELREETGYRAGSIRHIGKFSSSSGMTDEVVDGYIAQDCVRISPDLILDESEYIEPMIVPYSQFDQLIFSELVSGRAVDPKLLAMMYYFRTFCLQK